MALLAYLERHFPAPLKRSSTQLSPHPASLFRTFLVPLKQQWSDGDLLRRCFTELGVDVCIEGDLYSFKYNLLVVKDWTAAVDECRGTTVERFLDPQRGEYVWRYATRPFAKFFNKDEPTCPLRDDALFMARLSEFVFAEKADGTCIQLWHLPPERIDAHTAAWRRSAHVALPLEDEPELDEEVKTTHSEAASGDGESEKAREVRQLREAALRKKLKRLQRRAQAGDGEDERDDDSGGVGGARACVQRGGWRCSTLGRITPSAVLESLFWRFFAAADTAALSSVLSPEVTYLFELCCAENRVVTRYASDRLYLIGARTLHAGHTLSPDALDALAQQLCAVGVNVMRPRVFLGSDVARACGTVAAVQEWVEAEARRTDVYGEHAEGFVVCERNGTPVCKLKNKAYFGVHQLRTHSLLMVRTIAIERFFAGTIDDVLADCPEPIQAFVEELKGKVHAMVAEIDTLARTLRSRLQLEEAQELTAAEFKTQFLRAYVAEVKALVPPAYQGFFLQFKLEVTQGVQDVKALFMGAWLRDKYTHFDAHWKLTQVPEILAEMRQQHLLPTASPQHASAGADAANL